MVQDAKKKKIKWRKEYNNRENNKVDSISNLNSMIWAMWTTRAVKFYNLIFKL